MLRHVAVEEVKDKIIGKTYDGFTYFGEWVKYPNLKGKAPSSSELALIEQDRILLYEAFRRRCPEKYIPSPRYYEVCEKYPLLRGR